MCALRLAAHLQQGDDLVAAVGVAVRDGKVLIVRAIVAARRIVHHAPLPLALYEDDRLSR